MTRSFSCLWVVLHLLVVCAVAAPPNGGDRRGPSNPSQNGRRPEPKPIPEFKVVKSDKPSLLDSLGGMVVSDPYPTDYNWVQTGIDTTEVEVKFLSDFVHFQGKFAANANLPDKSQLFIKLNRYNMGDPRVTALLIEAHKLGMNVQFMTDLSRTARNIRYDQNGRFKDFYLLKPEDFDTDSKHNPKGKAIADMLRAGAQFADPTHNQFNPSFGIYGIMYQERVGVENPLQHMKGLLVGRKVGDDVVDIWGTDGTGNMVPHEADGAVDRGTRSNRMIIEHDRDYLMTNYNHFEVMRDTYARGGETKDIPLEKVPPVEIRYPNGDIRRVMFTDGQYNPHDMTALVLLRSVLSNPQLVRTVTDKNPALGTLLDRMIANGEVPNQSVKITKVKVKEFLLTNRSIYQSILLAMNANPKLTLEGAMDQEFGGLETQGYFGPLHGFLGMREFGGNTPGVSPSVWSRNHLHIYQRLIEGQQETTRDESWLVHYLLHDKTIMFWVEEPDGTTKVHIFTKSFNMSSHVDNAEELDELIVAADSPIAKAFEESIDKPIEREPQWYIPGPEGILRDAIARLTGHAEVELHAQDVSDIMNAYHDKNLSAVRDLLERLSRRQGTLANWKEMNDYRIKARLDRFVGFLKWQIDNDGALYDPNFRETLDQRFAGMAVLLANQDPLDQHERVEIMRDPFQAALAVQALLWKPEIDKNPAIQERRARDVWENALGLGRMPESPIWPDQWKGGRISQGAKFSADSDVRDGVTGPQRRDFRGYGDPQPTNYTDGRVGKVRSEDNRPSQNDRGNFRGRPQDNNNGGNFRGRPQGDSRGNYRGGRPQDDNRGGRPQDDNRNGNGRPQQPDFRGNGRGPSAPAVTGNRNCPWRSLGHGRR